MLVKTIHSLMNTAINQNTTENYTNAVGGRTKLSDLSNSELLVTMMTLIIIYALLLIFGKYLWNQVLVKIVTIVKPVNSVWQIFGLVVLISLLFQR